MEKIKITDSTDNILKSKLQCHGFLDTIISISSGPWGAVILSRNCQKLTLSSQLFDSLEYTVIE